MAPPPPSMLALPPSSYYGTSYSDETPSDADCDPPPVVIAQAPSTDVAASGAVLPLFPAADALPYP